MYESFEVIAIFADITDIKEEISASLKEIKQALTLKEEEILCWTIRALEPKGHMAPFLFWIRIKSTPPPPHPPIPPYPLFQRVNGGPVMWNSKTRSGVQYLLYDKQSKRYRENDVVSHAWDAVAKDPEFIESCKNKLILLFHVSLGKADNLGVERNSEFVLFWQIIIRRGRCNNRKC